MSRGRDRGERRTPRAAPLPGHAGIDDELEGKLREVAGLTPEQMYERRGSWADRGLAAFLEKGDRIVSVQSDHVVIEKADGAVQRFWNLDRPSAFLRPSESDPELAHDEGQ